MHFNLTLNTFKIWVVTVVAVLALYEVMKYLVKAVWSGKARSTMCALFLSVVFSHYYAWWMYFNYYNDEFYSQFYHQTFFTLTELVSTSCVVYLISTDNPMRPRLILTIIR